MYINSSTLTLVTCTNLQHLGLWPYTRSQFAHKRYRQLCEMKCHFFLSFLCNHFLFYFLMPLGVRREGWHTSLVQRKYRLQWYTRLIYYESVAFTYMLYLYDRDKLYLHITVILFPVSIADACSYLKTKHDFRIFCQWNLTFIYVNTTHLQILVAFSSF